LNYTHRSLYIGSKEKSLKTQRKNTSFFEKKKILLKGIYKLRPARTFSERLNLTGQLTLRVRDASNIILRQINLKGERERGREGGREREREREEEPLALHYRSPASFACPVNTQQHVRASYK